MKSIRTPWGVTLPSVVYAAVVSLAITLGSALTMARLDLPWWVWVVEFLLLLAVTFSITESNSTPAGAGFSP
ncbi:hypothetical protein A3Q41_02138 [Rhodococcoides fascians]|uniref:Uncharacterized protein n=1 Tax=Rhodococcoides fascians TaxID=1828 RepID=A0A143QK65_RHOFA|nr:hypothetical protein A3Q41_02138 [Rhodococcus fascians]KMJ50524.1 hypothetical protein ACG96_06970 [Rhodococcus fascians]OZC38441.1 hypothetical protein CHX23_20520 [Rhodococcus fascians]